MVNGLQQPLRWSSVRRMDTNPVFAIRLANLRHLIRTWDGPSTLGKRLGHANGSFLVQLAGPNPRRSISEKVARSIEQALGLAPRWLDEQHHDASAQIDDSFLRECVRMVAVSVKKARISGDADVIANISAIAYEHARAVGTVEQSFIDSLVDLAKPKH